MSSVLVAHWHEATIESLSSSRSSRSRICFSMTRAFHCSGRQTMPFAGHPSWRWITVLSLHQLPGLYCLVVPPSMNGHGASLIADTLPVLLPMPDEDSLRCGNCCA